ncbi:MAG: hypothetical protein K0U36_04760 [Alphaproteobacteria bacterium]|nr:hypothetical protein [Alphaproteobacteria bacterium]
MQDSTTEATPESDTAAEDIQQATEARRLLIAKTCALVIGALIVIAFAVLVLAMTGFINTTDENPPVQRLPAATSVQTAYDGTEPQGNVFDLHLPLGCHFDAVQAAAVVVRCDDHTRLYFIDPVGGRVTMQVNLYPHGSAPISPN